MENNKIWALVLLGIFFYLSQSSSTIIIQPAPQGSNNSNLADLIDADVSFTGINKYVQSTSLTGELVRIFRLNGGREDLGTKSLNSGALNVKPNVNYKYYFFMNETLPSTNFYVNIQDYTGKLQDSTDNIVGQGCSIDTKPVVVVRNSAGQVQSSSSNAQSLAATGNIDIEVEIKSHTDKCYGMPDVSKPNAVCFAYSTTAFDDIKSSTNFISVPRSVTSLGQGTVKCFGFAVLADASSDILTISLDASTTEPTIAHNISIFTDDLAFDLNKNNLDEIFDYTDEDGNQLARVINATPDGKIYIS